MNSGSCLVVSTTPIEEQRNRDYVTLITPADFSSNQCVLIIENQEKRKFLLKYKYVSVQFYLPREGL